MVILSADAVVDLSHCDLKTDVGDGARLVPAHGQQIGTYRHRTGAYVVDRDILPTLQYYFPGGIFESYSSEAESPTDVMNFIENGAFDGLLCPRGKHVEVERMLVGRFRAHAEPIGEKFIHFALPDGDSERAQRGGTAG